MEPVAEESSGEEVIVQAQRPAESASDRALDRAAIEALPGRSADDLLRAMPGLHLSAHGGHGKAYQYFLRGFDAVHGADIGVALEGVPINEVSNVHGHGYLDLHFIPPVLVKGVELRPGTWRADTGDFAVAGSADFSLGLEEAGGQAWIGGGTDLGGTATLAWRPKTSKPGTFLVADVDLGRGVGEEREWRQIRAGAGWEGVLGATRARAFVLSYDGVFESPGVLREDDLAAGEGGRVHRAPPGRARPPHLRPPGLAPRPAPTPGRLLQPNHGRARPDRARGLEALEPVARRRQRPRHRVARRRVRLPFPLGPRRAAQRAARAPVHRRGAARRPPLHRTELLMWTLQRLEEVPVPALAPVVLGVVPAFQLVHDDEHGAVAEQRLDALAIGEVPDLRLPALRQGGEEHVPERLVGVLDEAARDHEGVRREMELTEGPAIGPPLRDLGGRQRVVRGEQDVRLAVAVAARQEDGPRDGLRRNGPPAERAQGADDLGGGERDVEECARVAQGLHAGRAGGDASWGAAAHGAQVDHIEKTAGVEDLWSYGEGAAVGGKGHRRSGGPASGMTDQFGFYGG